MSNNENSAEGKNVNVFFVGNQEFKNKIEARHKLSAVSEAKKETREEIKAMMVNYCGRVKVLKDDPASAIQPENEHILLRADAQIVRFLTELDGCDSLGLILSIERNERNKLRQTVTLSALDSNGHAIGFDGIYYGQERWPDEGESMAGQMTGDDIPNAVDNFITNTLGVPPTQ